MPEVKVEYDKQDIRLIIKSYKAMSDEAVEQGKKVGYELAQELVTKIRGAAKTVQEKRIAETGRAKKSSKIGEFSFGFARKSFSGGATTEKNLKGSPYKRKGAASAMVSGGWYGPGILAGVEFGSDLYARFRPRSPREGAGNKGYFIYPTLKNEQPAIIARWEKAFDEILKEFK